MRRSFILVAALLLSVLIGSIAFAAVEFDFSAQARFRAEYDGRSFVDGNTAKQYNLMRTRVNADINSNENVSAFIQLQDSRTQGQLTDAGARSSGGLNDGKNVDLHQGYIKIKHFFGRFAGLKAGRFEFNLGNQRVFGAVGWHNVGRTWDGIIILRECDARKAKLFWLKGEERNFDDYDGDFDIIGAQVTLKKFNLDLFGFYEYDGLLQDSTFEVDTGDVAVSADVKTLKRFNFGTYGFWQKNDFDFELNAAYQTGKRLAWVMSADSLSYSADEYDIGALMFTFEIGYSMKSEIFKRFSAGIDYSSGDDKSDDEIKSYENSYYTGHKFRGYMDNFIGSKDFGLIDMIFRSKFVLLEGWDFGVDAHYFKTAADYADFNGKLSSDVGFEIDMVASTKNIEGIDLALGGALFFPSESYVGIANPDITYWFFTQLTANFK